MTNQIKCCNDLSIIKIKLQEGSNLMRKNTLDEERFVGKIQREFMNRGNTIGESENVS